MKKDFPLDFSRPEVKVGRLEIKTDFGRPLPLKIFHPDWRPVGVSLTENDIRLPYGQYFVKVKLPGEKSQFLPVKISNQKPITHLIQGEAARDPALGDAAKSSIIAGSKTFQLSTFSKVADFGAGALPQPRATNSKQPTLQSFCFKNGKWARDSTRVKIQPDQHNDVYTLVFGHSGPMHERQLSALEVKKTGRKTVGILLPAGELIPEFKLSILDDGRQLRLTTSVKVQTELEALWKYLRTNEFENASFILEQARSYLYEKMINPVTAALGGYVLLRLNELDRMSNWPDNLAEWFPWMPDGAIIAGELAARKNDHERAITYFLHAASNGIPIFTQGFSLLSSRLRFYLLADEKEFGGKHLKKLSQAVDAVSSWSYAVDFNELITTILDCPFAKIPPVKFPENPPNHP